MTITKEDILEALLTGDLTKITTEGLDSAAASSPIFAAGSDYQSNKVTIVAKEILDENEDCREKITQIDEFSSLEEFAAILLKHSNQDKSAIINFHSLCFAQNGESSISKIAFRADYPGLKLAPKIDWRFPLENLLPTLSALGYASAEILSCRTGIKIKKEAVPEASSLIPEILRRLEKPMPVLISSGKYSSLTRELLLELEEDFIPEIHDLLPETLSPALKRTIASFATKIIRNPNTYYFAFGDRHFKKSGPKPESSDDLANFRVKAYLENDLQRFWGFCQETFPEHEFDRASLSIETKSLLDEEAINLYKNRAAFVETHRGKTANAKLYLKAGANWRYSISNDEQRNLLFLACDDEKLDLVQNILEHYFNFETDPKIAIEAFLLSITHRSRVGRDIATMFLNWIKGDLGESLIVNCVNSEGISPLHQACIIGDLDFVEKLIKEHANLDAKTIRSGMTPLDFAIKEKHEEVVKLLSNPEEVAKLLLDSGDYDGVEYDAEADPDTYGTDSCSEDSDSSEPSTAARKPVNSTPFSSTPASQSRK